MCYFVYHIDKIALHWLEKSTLLMDENKRIDNPWISALAPRLKMKKCVEKLQEQTMSVIFNIKNSQLLAWFLPIEEIFQVDGQNRPVANLSVVDFRSQLREMSLPKSLNT